MPSITVRPVTPEDSEAWLRLRCLLWPDGSEAEHRAEIADFLSRRSQEPLAVLVASDSITLAGFVELSLRPYAEGCRTSPVAYLEGWYVVSEARHRGIGRMLIQAAEHWARERGCAEFASDARPDNDVSVRAHHAVGFADAGMVRCFYKAL